MAFDFSTLPKARAYGYMGGLYPQARAYMDGLGQEEPCSWNPTTWPNCINVYRNARREFQENYTKIIQMENTYHTALQNLNAQESSPARDEIMALTQARLQEIEPVRIQGIQIANQLEAKIAEWSWIPGFDTIFLNGLGRKGRLGALPLLVPVGAPMLILYSITGLVAVTSLAYIVGQLAQSWRASEDTQIAKHNAYGKCLEAYDRAVASGVRGSDLPRCSEPMEQDWTTVALIGGSVILAVMLLARK